MNASTLELFNKVWRILESDYKVDCFGGMEYRHALTAFITKQFEYGNDIETLSAMYSALTVN